MQRVVTHWWPSVGGSPGAHTGGGGGARLASEGIFQAKRQVLGNQGQGLEQPSRSCLLLQCPTLISCPSSPPTGQFQVPTQSCLDCPLPVPGLLSQNSCPGPAGVP